METLNELCKEKRSGLLSFLRLFFIRQFFIKRVLFYEFNNRD